MNEFNGIDRRRVEPAGTGRGRDDQCRTLEPSDTLQFGQCDLRTLLQSVPCVEPGIDPDGLHRLTPKNGRYFLLRRPDDDKSFTVPANIVPGNKRSHTAGRLVVLRRIILIVQQPIHCGKRFIRYMQ